MTRWWLRNGSWWLAGIAVLTLVNHLFFLGTPINAPIPTMVLVLANQLLYMLPIVLAVIAASVCDRFIYQFYEEQAAPVTREAIWGRYLLALLQVIPIAIVTTTVSIASSIVNHAQARYLGAEPPIGIWIFTLLVGSFSGYMRILTWLILFVVLAAKRPLLKYAIFIACIFEALLTGTHLLGFVQPALSFIYNYSEFQLLYLFALPLWLVAANALLSNKYKVAGFLIGIITISIAGNAGAISLYMVYGGKLLHAVALSTELVISPYSMYTQYSSPFADWLSSTFNPKDTILGYLPFIIMPILSWWKPAIFFGSIYLFVFSSYPGRWVDYLREKLSSSG